MEEAGENSLTGVATLLRQRMGLSPLTLGTHGVGDAVRARMSACGLKRPEAYLERLHRDEEEVQRLVEEVSIPEGWFFRDVKPYLCLRHHVQEVWRARAEPGPLRVLSIPCGNGEEPYSAAMTLLDLGLGAGRAHVDAADISRRALEQARAGVYRRRSLREKDLDCRRLLERYLEAEGEGYRVRAEVGRLVHFHQANLISPTLLAGHRPYHFVFCRNLFIYLDAAARQTALASLRRLLAPGGVLYVGHVEGGIPQAGGFRGYHPGFPFAFTHQQGRAALPALPARGKGRPEARPASAAWPTREAQAAREVPAGQPGQEALEAARAAANQGQLDRAAGLCLGMLEQSPLDAEAHFLLALVRAAQGSLAEAEGHLRRALYLDPDHREALVYRALLARRRGDEKLAEQLYQRAARLGEGGGR